MILVYHIKNHTSIGKFVKILLNLLILHYNLSMNTRIDYLKDKVKKLPLKPGVYKMFDAQGNIIYIGKAKNLKNRVSSYFVNTAKPEKVMQMVKNIYDFDYIVVTSEFEALNLESNLIHYHQPFYNILLKDGKAFPYIKINPKQKFPKIEITRRVKKDKCLYFGPFFNNIKATDLYNIINSTFKLRDCNTLKAKRECLNYEMGTCLAPCTNKVTEEEYNEEVRKVINFLKGDLTLAKQILTERMYKCSEYEQFERAMQYKQYLKLIENINAHQVTNLNSVIDVDVFGFATNGSSAVISVLVVRAGKMVGLNNYNVINIEDGEASIETFVPQYYSSNVIPKTVVTFFESEGLKNWLNENAGQKVDYIFAQKGKFRKLLDLANLNARQDLEKSISSDKLHELKTMGAMKTLQSSLGLRHLPYRIEGYDISHISGTNTVASMVVFVNGEPLKAHYRKFKIDIDKPNDFECMREVLARRVKEFEEGGDVSFSQKPDLMLIDGGKGQLSYAYEVITNMGFDVDMVSLAKREEEIFKPGESEPRILSRNNYALKLLQNVRDESHRFAITFHRKTRDKNTLKSRLLSIDGVGEATVKTLYEHFKSFDKIASAGLLELSSINGITKKQALNINEYFENL